MMTMKAVSVPGLVVGLLLSLAVSPSNGQHHLRTRPSRHLQGLGEGAGPAMLDGEPVDPRDLPFAKQDGAKCTEWTQCRGLFCNAMDPTSGVGVCDRRIQGNAMSRCAAGVAEQCNAEHNLSCINGFCQKSYGACCGSDEECGSGRCQDNGELDLSNIDFGKLFTWTAAACGMQGKMGRCVEAAEGATCTDDSSSAESADDLPCENGLICQYGQCVDPSKFPSYSPTGSPSASPSSSTDYPSKAPTPTPSDAPTATPSVAPSDPPTPSPSDAPTTSPSDPPTPVPTASPSEAPTPSPTVDPRLRCGGFIGGIYTGPIVNVETRPLPAAGSVTVKASVGQNGALYLVVAEKGKPSNRVWPGSNGVATLGNLDEGDSVVISFHSGPASNPDKNTFGVELTCNDSGGAGGDK